MIEYLLLLLSNSLFILGIYTLFQENHLLSGIGKAIDNLLSARIHPDKVDEVRAKGLWARTEADLNAFSGEDGHNPYRGLTYAYYPIWKPIKGCYECMASLWGIGYFLFAHLINLDWWPFAFSWNVLWILPVYLISLVAVNRLIGRWMDL